MVELKGTNEEVLAELGSRLERHRLRINWTQAKLAKEAGLSKTTIERLEDGKAIRTNSLIRVLRALDLLQALDALIPVSVPSPIQHLKLQGRQRQRASSPRPRPSTGKAGDRKSGWGWGDGR